MEYRHTALLNLVKRRPDGVQNRLVAWQSEPGHTVARFPCLGIVAVQHPVTGAGTENSDLTRRCVVRVVVRPAADHGNIAGQSEREDCVRRFPGSASVAIDDPRAIAKNTDVVGAASAPVRNHRLIAWKPEFQIHGRVRIVSELAVKIQHPGPEPVGGHRKTPSFWPPIPLQLPTTAMSPGRPK